MPSKSPQKILSPSAKKHLNISLERDVKGKKRMKQER
jgi:hypothetical protein